MADQPSEASLREARELLEPFRSAMDAQFAVARALDKQKEHHARIAEPFGPIGVAVALAIRNSTHD